MNQKLIGGILLVAGTTIGAGMLALPTTTGLSGFLPTCALFIAYWLFMRYTAFLILEVNLWIEGHANIISMAKKTLGKWGEVVSWFVYLFLLYALTTAYIAGSGPIFLEFIEAITGIHLPSWSSPIPLLVIFGFFVYKGTKAVDRVNRLLMFGLLIAYFSLICFLIPHIDSRLLHYVNWSYLTLSVSIVATSFGFHIIIPSLTTYMERDVKQLRRVISIGSAIPLIVYILWAMLALGIIPLEGAYGLMHGYENGLSATQLISNLLDNPYNALAARCFAFFAIVTSFLGVSLSLSDFLSDGLKIEKSRKGRLLVYCLTFGPPLAFVLTDPRAFFSALEYAGAFGVIILLGLLPALMVWRGRYFLHLDQNSIYKAPGGKFALSIVILLSLIVIGIEIANKIGIN
jgi:tyrosine-specific transport protein